MQKYNATEFLGFVESNARFREGADPTMADLRAEQMLRGAISDFPDDHRPTRALTQRLMARSRYQEALEINRERYDAHPQDVRTGSMLLQLQLMCGEFEEANRTFAAASETHKEHFLKQGMVGRYFTALLEGDWFLREDMDFRDLFFIGELAGKVAGIKQSAALFANKYYLEYIDFSRKFVQNAGGTFVYCSVDNLFAVKNKSPMELAQLNEGIWQGEQSRPAWLQSKPRHIVEQYSHIPDFSDEYIRQVTTGGKIVLQATRAVLADYQTEFSNVRNNLRVTTDAPESWNRRVLILGASDAYGSGVEDKMTFASQLQRSLNAAHPNEFRVENHGVGGHPIPMCVLNLVQTRVNPGDVVIMYGYAPLSSTAKALPEVQTHHISFARPHDHGEVFSDHFHLGPKGHEVVGDDLAQVVLDQPAERVPTQVDLPPISKTVDFLKYLIFRRSADIAETGQLKEYVDFLRDSKVDVEGTIGSVAVNCNPMTLGHLHLLEYAASQVDFLYVFVIEEDQSFFPFIDRLDVVTKGLGHLPNVVVLRGGRYICTQLTFPEYFDKDDVQEVAADASMEAWFFCEYIAKALGITIIFLGNEPTCEITNQYNSKMAEILPEYDITVDIIPRISEGGAIISASSVRRFLNAGDFASIRKIVPDATFNYLVEKYGQAAKSA